MVRTLGQGIVDLGDQVAAAAADEGHVAVHERVYERRLCMAAHAWLSGIGIAIGCRGKRRISAPLNLHAHCGTMAAQLRWRTR